MESECKIQRGEHPRKRANVLSIATFSWLIPIFVKGLKKEFQEEDLYEPLNDHEASRLGDLLEAAWKKEQKKVNPSFWMALGRVFGLKLLFLGFVLFFIEVVVKIVQPLALGQLIMFYTSPNSGLTKSDAYIYASLIVGSSFLNVIIAHQYMLGNQHTGMQIRVASCSLIYRKALKLSKTSLKDTTIGQMVNLLSNDVGRFDTAINHIHGLWVCPIEAAIIVTLIYFHLGFTATLGSIFLVLFIPVQMYLGKKSSVYRLATAFRTDERVRLMDEIISGIQVIKMYTWEKPFIKLVSFVRKREIKQILFASYIRGFMLSLKVFAVKVSIYLCILAYFLSGEYLSAQYVFVLTSYYNILRTTLVMQFPNGITEFAETYVSVKRVKTFLLYEEKETDNDFCQKQGEKIGNIENGKVDLRNGYKLVEKVKPSENEKLNHQNVDNENIPVTIKFKGAYAKWSNNENDSTLNNVNLEITKTILVAIIGHVGSGKTSLLHVLLKELPLTEGSLQICGKLSYASQEPWLFAGSIRQNIIFGNVFDVERYENVIRVCALERDFTLFPFGDNTIVGERGTTLSGGQRARINLARAVYQKADIYLLDDPLSAVDTHVGKHLFEECIRTFLKEKLVILVTHQLQYLHNADRIILLEGGKIVQDGKFNEMRDNFQFLEELEKHEENEMEEENYEEEPIIKKTKSKSKEQLAPVQYNEGKASGNVSKKVYWSYLHSDASWFSVFFIFLLFILCQVLVSGGDYFITYWTNVEQNVENGNTDGAAYFIRDNGIYIYTAIVVLNVVATLMRMFMYYNFCMKTSQNIHNKMFSHIVYATMRFFNINPSGRILNRFSKDMGNVDEMLPGVLIDCLQIGLTVIGISVVISIVNYWMIIASVLVFALFYWLRVLFLATSRSIKRLEGVTRSPIFTHLHASLQGLTTIRAFKAEEMLRKEFDKHQNLHSATYYMFLACSRAFGYWLDLICVIYIASVTYSFLLMPGDQYGGSVGLAITQVLTLTGMLQWGMRQWSELENQMTSVERVLEYTEVETERERTKLTPNLSWPENGNIEFKSVYLKYSDDGPYILKDLNFVIKPQEKIGIVGRTGAGKSSIITALFQLSEIEGSILIDNLDITEVPLDRLRCKISIIPQEPVLFSGTLRKNLDPFEEYSDETLWNALEQVQLKQVVAELNLGLNTKMSEGGSNFSVGQRQLVCLARAIIRNNKILIMDEATANIDHHTDQLIQETIRRQFVDCTVLTIAHRLHTVMDSDKILVLDSGRIMEFDSPYNLLQNSGGWLYSLVQDMGSSMMENLYKIAKEAHENNKH